MSNAKTKYDVWVKVGGGENPLDGVNAWTLEWFLDLKLENGRTVFETLQTYDIVNQRPNIRLFIDRNENKKSVTITKKNGESL